MFLLWSFQTILIDELICYRAEREQISVEKVTSGAAQTYDARI